MATDADVRAVLETSLHGNHLALDFVNTVDWRGSPERRRDLLVDQEVAAHWAQRLGIVGPDERDDLVSWARRRPRAATAALQRAVELREDLYEIFAAVAAGERAPERVLRGLRSAYADAVAHARFDVGNDGYRLTWDGTALEDRVRRTVAAAAVELLTSERAARVRTCVDDACGWLFLDMSKNASRRWCSMEGCGARAKMRRQYRRKKGAARSPA